MNRNLATFITLAIPTGLFLLLMRETMTKPWQPSGSEAAGFIFLSFSFLGLFAAILSFSLILRTLLQKSTVSLRLFLTLACVVASIVSATAYFIYPIATSMLWSNFDPSLVIGVVVIQCLVAIPFASMWWWLTKPHTITS